VQYRDNLQPVPDLGHAVGDHPLQLASTWPPLSQPWMALAASMMVFGRRLGRLHHCFQPDAAVAGSGGGDGDQAGDLVVNPAELARQVLLAVAHEWDGGMHLGAQLGDSPVHGPVSTTGTRPNMSATV
jgi:hypothetical protein